MGKIILCLLLIFGLSGFANEPFVYVDINECKAKYFELLGKARACENGESVERNEEEAFRYYYKAATNYAYSEPQALERLKQKANEGNFYAEYYLAMYYHDHGQIMTYDPGKAFYWANRAAQKNYVRAIDYLAWCYIKGDGVGVDKKKGGELLLKAAELGFARSQYHVAMCYTEIPPRVPTAYKGVFKANYSDAIYWYKKAADQGDLPAKYDLGVCYFYGLGVPEDKSKAVEIWESMAKELCGQSKEDIEKPGIALSRCYYYGWGCEKDEKKSFDVFPLGNTPKMKANLYRILIVDKKRRYNTINFGYDPRP